jgi:hypothetical protein
MAYSREDTVLRKVWAFQEEWEGKLTSQDALSHVGAFFAAAHTLEAEITPVLQELTGGQSPS